MNKNILLALGLVLLISCSKKHLPEENTTTTNAEKKIRVMTVPHVITVSDKEGFATTLAGEQTGLVDSALKHLCELPPTTEEGDTGWHRFTRAIAELELARSAATALWYRAVKYQSSDNLDAASVAAAMAHIGCSAAVRQVALQIDTVFTAVDEAFVDKLRARARSTDLLLGGWTLQRLLVERHCWPARPPYCSRRATAPRRAAER